MAESATITIERDGAVGMVRIVGELDLSTQRVLAETSRPLFDDPAVQHVQIDASGVRFMDSAGLTSLPALRAAASAFGASVELTGASPHVARVLDMTGVSDLFLQPPHQRV